MNRADVSLSRTCTMVWFSSTATVKLLGDGSPAGNGRAPVTVRLRGGE